jgi:hypothetical protein
MQITQDEAEAARLASIPTDPLLLAIHQKNEGLAMHILATGAGVDLSLLDPAKMDALSASARRGMDKLTVALLDAGGDPNAPNNIHHPANGGSPVIATTPFITAMIYRDVPGSSETFVSLLEKFLQAGGNPIIENQSKHGVLVFLPAVLSRKPDMVEHVLQTVLSDPKWSWEWLSNNAYQENFLTRNGEQMTTHARQIAMASIENDIPQSPAARQSPRL